jgi:TfoX/Sxy family transcriptional regulator of competence genes
VAHDERLASRVRAALAHRQDVEEKKMFGGITFLVGGKMCVSVGKTRLMCRIDPAVHDAALQRRGCRTVVMNGRQYRGFVYVDGDTVRSERELGRWIRLALDFNTRANPASRKRR